MCSSGSSLADALFYEERTARTASARSASWLVFCKDQGATIKLSKGGEPLAPFVAWRKRAAKAEAKK